jgi:hypothetical protein
VHRVGLALGVLINSLLALGQANLPPSHCSIFSVTE